MCHSLRKSKSAFCYFKTSPEIIRLVVMMYVRFPLSLRNVERLLYERSMEICHEGNRFWADRYGPVLAREIKYYRYLMALRMVFL